MTLNWFQSLIIGFFSGIADILPVSAQAHKAVLLTLFGVAQEPPLLRIFIHIATFCALYFSCQQQIMRMIRQKQLARIPKQRRKRPVDLRILMDIRLVFTMAIPLVLMVFFYQKAAGLYGRLSWIALFLVINAVILYLPNVLPSGNKDSRSLSRLEAVLIGLGGAASVVPGISSMGSMTSLGSICGAERSYMVGISLMMQMVITAILIFFDFISLFTVGFGVVGFGAFIGCLLAALAAFGGTYLGIKIIRAMAVNIGFSIFAYYSIGLAVMTFVLYLSAV